MGMYTIPAVISTSESNLRSGEGKLDHETGLKGGKVTDRIHSITVVLANDMREDDCEKLVAAIVMMRGVLSAKMHVTDLTEHMAYERARANLGEKLWEVLYPKYADKQTP